MGAGEPAAWRGDEAGREGTARALDEVRLRGVAFHSAMTAIGTIEGPGALAKALERLEGAARDPLIDRTLMATGWYPVSWYGALLRAMQEATGRGPELSREVGRVAATQDFRGIFRHVLRFASPELLARHAVTVYGFYARGGDLRAPERGRGFARFSWQRCGGYDADIWQDNFGATEALFELSGGVETRIEVIAGGVGDFAEVRVSWRG